jgi:hypothetical protein
MGSSTVLWAGKRLTDEEELGLRRLVSLMERAGSPAAAEDLARFLPERAGEWTPDELETGAHCGPWMGLGAGLEQPPS